jgi:two-component system phosphate regulon sensor histidine kinase PhoR
MTTAVLGITAIQFYWIKSSVDLDSKNFDDKVRMALNKVRERLDEEANREESFLKYYNQKGTGLFGQDDQLRSKILPNQTKFEITSNTFYLQPKLFLENIDPQKLDIFIKQELGNQGIDLVYDYGVYSFENEDFIITNGNYAIILDNEPQASVSHLTRSLQTSSYEVQLFDMESIEAPGSLKMFFPNKTSYLWSSVWPIMLCAIIFTGLILFCFSYVVYIILKQKKVSEMKTDFINNMTHEFKTPIATISLAADSINSPRIIEEPSKVKRFISIIKQENKRMLNQVERVLQMSQLDKENFELKLSEVNLHNVINQAVEYNLLKIRKRNGTIETQLDAKNPVIEADQTHMQNLIHNLLDNANKYSPDKPEISIISQNVNGGVEVIIKDNGMGMSRESLKHIFDKFYRVHTGNIHNIKGFGLGLSYVKAIVDAHHAKIDVKSELNKGSSFILHFPFKLSD